MKKCIIIGAGDFTPPSDITKNDLVIAADGGYDHAKKCGITPDLLIGDMDSVNAEIDCIEKIIYPTHKDFTDMSLAYFEGQKRGCTEFEIYGGNGGRSDHTMANISLLLKISKNGKKAKMISEHEVFTVIHNTGIEIKGEAGKYISVFAIDGDSHGVTLTGLEYNLENATLTEDFALGVSNRFTEKEAKICVKSGSLLIIYQK